MEHKQIQDIEMNIAIKPSLNVTEGLELDQQPELKLVNRSNGLPVSNYSCIAFLNGKDQDIYPKGYRVTYQSKITIFLF